MNYEIGPILMQPDPLRPGFSYKVRNPRCYKAPEIVSFTQILKENYVVEYGQFIRREFAHGRLPVPYFGAYSKPVIVDVLIDKGYYDQLDSFSFAMYVICDVHFYDPVTGEDYYQKYCVNGYHAFYSPSDYFLGVDIYRGERLRLKHHLDDCLVPYIRKAHYDAYAYNFLLKYQPEALEGPCKIDIESLVKAMGYRIQVEQLSRNGKVKAKTIFHTKMVTVYEGDKAVQKLIEGGTILVSSKCDPDYLMNILHECIHIEYHMLFYELQYYYRSLVKLEIPDFDEFFMSEDQQDTIRSMEIQANAISARAVVYKENLDITLENFKDELGRDIHHTDLYGYERLIEHITETYGSYRTTAKNRLHHLGFKRVRGVFEWGDRSYAKAHEIPDDFPDDWTYTLPIEEMSKILGTNLTFDKLVFSGSFVYADGHLCLNHPDYVINFNGRWWLTEKAKKNMAECCLPFRRVYGKENYRYTFGELNKEQQARFYEMAFSAEQLKALEANRDEYLLSLLTVEYEENGVKQTRKMTGGETVKFLMKRSGMTEDAVAEAADCSVETLTALRSKKKYTPRLGTMLAFFTALNLEEVYRNELLIMTKLISEIDSEEYKTYLWFKNTVPGFNVYQVNDYLRSIGKSTWTTGYKPRSKAQKAV